MVQPIAPNSTGDSDGGSSSSNVGNGSNNAYEPTVGFVAGARRRTNINNLNRSQMQRDGAYMYREFLNNEFQRQNLPDPSQYMPAGTANDPSPDVSRATAQLRVVSAEFARSPMRQWVLDQAARVPLEQLDFQAFSQLLYGLFQEGGVTWERLVVLFYFCTDLAARAVRESAPRRLQLIIEWSFQFFSGDRIIQWVFDNGGWLSVLQGWQGSAGRAFQMATMGVFVMGAVFLGVYLWRSN